MCGLAGALASNPVDVVRTRMMNQRGGAMYQGTIDCIVQVRQLGEICLSGRVSCLSLSLSVTRPPFFVTRER